MIPATRKNIIGRKATAPLTAWLIAAAKAGTNLTYQEAKRRLEQEQDFDTILYNENRRRCRHSNGQHSRRGTFRTLA